MQSASPPRPSRRQRAVQIQGNNDLSLNSYYEQEQIYIRPVYSTRNLHTHRTPPSRHFPRPRVHPTTQLRQRQLQRDNNRLMTSLDLLHEGAVSAIAQKQMQIDNMQSSLLQGEELRCLEEEVAKLRKERADLRGEVEEMEEQLRQERGSYQLLLEEKDRVIEELCCQVESRGIEIQKMQKGEELSLRKLRVIQDENNALFQQLQQQKLERIHMQKKMEKESEQQQQRERKLSRQMQQSVIEEEPFELDSSEEIAGGQLSRSTSAQQMVEEIIRLRESLRLSEQHHHHETAQLTSFFNKRISDMRDIYEKELQSSPAPFKCSERHCDQYTEDDLSSLRQTQVNHHALSHELQQMKRLSDCASVVGRQMSLLENESVYDAEGEMAFQSRLSFAKRVSNLTPQSRTTASNKLGRQASLMVGTIHPETSPSMVGDWRWGERVGVFLLGSLTGGGIVFSVFHLLNNPS